MLYGGIETRFGRYQAPGVGRGAGDACSLQVLSIPAFDAATVRERWEDMRLAERRSVVAGAFERIEVRAATTTRYDPGRIGLVWRNNEAGSPPLDVPPA